MLGALGTEAGMGGTEETSQAGIHLICVLEEKALGKKRIFQKGGIL